MYATLAEAINRLFRTIIDWNFIQKSQAVLIYATLIDCFVYFLKMKYLHEPFLNTGLLLYVQWFFPTIISVNLILIAISYFARNKEEWHYPLLMIGGMFISIPFIFIAIFIGILNVAVGLVFLGTVLVSMILFPRKIVNLCMLTCGLIYIIAAILTVMGKMDYALAFTPNILLDPKVEAIHISVSVMFAIVYFMVTIYLFDTYVTSWKERGLQKEKLSNTDELTGLLNRRGLNEMVNLNMQNSRKNQREISLIVVDVDNFKKINDKYGHHQGDIVLKHVAQVLRENLRAHDIVGRYGGEEFIVLLPSTSIKNAMLVAEMCREALENSPVDLAQDEVLQVQASFGVSSTASSDFDYDVLFEKADHALYLAKNNGKNQVRAA